MMHISSSISDFAAMIADNEVHTVELAAPDTQGHLRGKRIPARRFLDTTYQSGAKIADAMFVFDMQNDLPDNEFVNIDTGYLDAHLSADVATGRVLTHRPGYAFMFADAENEHGAPHPLAPRGVLAAQIERCRAAGVDPFVATELEFFLCNPDWSPAQEHIQYSSLTDGLQFESVLHEIRDALQGAGIEVEGSNAEYGAGQFEVNTGPADAMQTADNTTLFKSIVKQVAVQHGLRATFMPKPWAEQSGSGMHVHTSLNAASGGKVSNAFAACNDGEPNEVMKHWLGGLMAHAPALTLLCAPTSNGPKRIRPYTFAPTHVTWGLDNRTVMARCIAESGSKANRVEFRAAGADANPYLIIAGILAAGVDGIEQKLDPGMLCVGDMYTNPGEALALPTDLAGAIAAFSGSDLASQLGDIFSRSYVSIAEAEVALAAENNPEPDDVNDWERARFIEHS